MNLSVDVVAGQTMRWNHRFRHTGHILDRGGVVALMADPDQFIAEAKQGDHFGRTRKQGADSHSIQRLCVGPETRTEFVEMNLCKTVNDGMGFMEILDRVCICDG